MELARPAVEDDIPRIAELAAEAVAELTPTRGGGVWAVRESRPLPAEPSLKEVLGDPDQLLLAGLIDDVVVGYAAVHAEDLRNGELLGVVDDIYVEPQARAVGVGEALMNAVVDWCRDKGCSGVDALALPGNRGTKNFFESFHLTARAIVVHRRIAEEPTEH